MSRRLSLPAFPDTDKNQHDDGDCIWEHLKQFLVAHSKIWNIVVDDEKSAE